MAGSFFTRCGEKAMEDWRPQPDLNRRRRRERVLFDFLPVYTESYHSPVKTGSCTGFAGVLYFLDILRFPAIM